MIRFALTQALCQEGMRLLENEGPVWVANDPDLAKYPEELRNAEGIIIRIGRLDGEAIAACPRLRVIGRTGVGYDSIDVEEATRRGIPVVLTPGANARAVAEQVLAMMLALSRNLLPFDAGLREGNYGIRNTLPGLELRGKTVGVIGLGAVGQETARLLRAVGMKVMGFDPFVPRETLLSLCDGVAGDYHELMPICDYLTLHAPLTPQTRQMIGPEELAAMKPGAMLINCARGDLVDEMALAAALNEERLAGAGMDVFAEDPPSVDHPLLHARHVLVTPHSAALTKEAVLNCALRCVEGCLSVLRGERWPQVANPQVYEHPMWKGTKLAGE